MLDVFRALEPVAGDFSQSSRKGWVSYFVLHVCVITAKFFQSTNSQRQMKKSTVNHFLCFISKPKLYLKFSNYVFEIFALCCACIGWGPAMLFIMRCCLKIILFSKILYARTQGSTKVITCNLHALGMYFMICKYDLYMRFVKLSSAD